MSKLVIASIGPASSVQDGGRPGAQRYGLVPSGSMDRLALAAANTLVGNEPFTAAVEVGPFGAKFTARGGAVRVALSGAPRNADIAGRAVASAPRSTWSRWASGGRSSARRSCRPIRPPTTASAGRWSPT